MDVFIHWVGFLGGWLLVGGPLFQASLELREEALDSEEFGRTMLELPPIKPMSPWWWLLPPVAYLKSRRQSKERRAAMLTAMTSAQRSAYVGFLNKAHGWFAVAGGAFLIAVKETGELVELYHLPDWVFWVAVVVLPFVVLAVVSGNLARADAVLHIDDPDYKAKQRAERERIGRFRREATEARKKMDADSPPSADG